MRMFNKEVYNEYQESSGLSRYTGAEFNALLGSAEKLMLQARCTKVSGSPPKLTVAVEHSDDGRDWTTAVTPINLVTLTNGVVNSVFGDTGTTILGAYVRLRVSLTDAGACSANIQVIVCGRGEQGGGAIG